MPGYTIRTPDGQTFEIPDGATVEVDVTLVVKLDPEVFQLMFGGLSSDLPNTLDLPVRWDDEGDSDGEQL